MTDKPETPEAEDEANIPDPVFPDIGEDEPEPEPDAAALSAEGIAELNKRFDAFRADAEQREQRLMSIIQQQAYAQQPEATPVVQPARQPAEMPDPVADPEGYGKAVVEAALAAQRAQQPQPQQDDGNLEARLWDNFKTRHTELAEFEDLVLSEGRRQVRDLLDRGVDARRYLAGNADAFTDSVATAVNARLTKIRGGEAAPDTGKPPPSRTGGVMPGGDTPARKAAGKGEDGPGRLTDELKKDQMALGFF